MRVRLAQLLSRRRAAVTFVVLAVLLGGGAVVARAAQGDDVGSRYRLTTATVADVDETLTVTGTVDAAGRADVSFPVEGTVARVRVVQGQRVRAGQVLAVLERSGLRATRTEARAALARAKAQLAADKATQAQAVSTAASTPAAQSDQPTSQPTNQPTSDPSTQPTSDPSTQPSTTDSGAAVTAAINAALAKLAKEQTAVLSAQSAVSAALTDASSALEAQHVACATAFQPDDSDSDTAATDTDPDADQACTAALVTVQDKQEAAADAETALADALTELTDTMTSALADIKAAAPTHGSASSQQPTQDQSSQTSTAKDQQRQESTGNTPATAVSDQSTGTVTAAHLAADQASIDQAQVALVQADVALAQAEIVAPFSGRVAALSVAKGDAVSASDLAATIVSGRAVVIETSVSESKIRQVRVGQRVQVTPVGSPSSTKGQVSTIGLTADTSSGTASYSVIVTVADPSVSLPVGSQATLAIVTGTTRDVVTVPASALTRVGSNGAVVRVLADGAVSATRVTVGTIGARRVAITDGLAEGAEVVLADLDQAITGAGTETGGPTTFGGPGGDLSRVGPGAGPPPG